MIPPIYPHETCSTYWARLTSAERQLAQDMQRISGWPLMTHWLLARGCFPVFVPTSKPTVRPTRITLNMALNGVTRRPAGHVR
jgi:hypothetical protein